MSLDYPKVVTDAFVNVGPRNPLKKLTDYDKHLLVALLVLHEHVPSVDVASNLLDEAARVAADAGKLAKRIRDQVLGGTTGELLAPLLKGGFKDLPARLEAFSELEIVLTNLAGKRGHKGKVGRNEHLLMASELVSLRLGQHYDEHLAELIQALTFNPDLSADADTSGDSIRKKREHFKRTYPLRYKHAVDRIRNIDCQTGFSNFSPPVM
jgi:hypothetical protein